MIGAVCPHWGCPENRLGPLTVRRVPGREAQRYSKLLVKMQPFVATCFNLGWKLLPPPIIYLLVLTELKIMPSVPITDSPYICLHGSLILLSSRHLITLPRLLAVVPWLRVTLCETATSAATASVNLSQYVWTPSPLWPQMLHPTFAHVPKDEVPVTSTEYNRSLTGFLHHSSKWCYLKTFLTETLLTQSVSYTDLVSNMYQKLYQEQELKKLIRQRSKTETHMKISG